MKKLMCTAVACSLMLCGLVGCGKDDDSKGASGNGFEGKWQCSEMVSDGTSLTTIPLFDIPLNALFHIEIKDNGTYVISTGVVGGDEESSTSKDAEGKWEKVDDDTIKFTKPEGATEATDSDGGLADPEMFEEAEFDLKDGNLVMSTEEEGKTLEIKFERVSEFATYDMSNLEFSMDMNASFEGELNGDGNFSMDGDVSFDAGSDDADE